jgi:N-acetylglucosaminyldiphosphoundecaprenol N-acetyl-beta-D-mannosaminyltransferase
MVTILGINLSDLRKDELYKRLEFFLNDKISHFLVTPNPEIILQAGNDEEYFYILNSADIAVADGFGLVLAGILKRKKIPRITGSDLTPWLLKLAEEKQIKTLIINRQDGLSSANDINQTLLNRWPKLNFKVLDTQKKESLTEEENNQINLFEPKLIFVTLGAPLQEKLIWHEIKQWPSARLALAVGGSFDFLTGKIKRAPKIFRIIGLEWLWRLIKQPSRFKRIWRATAVFGLKAFNSIIIQPFLFRSNVAIILYKKTADGIKILLVERQDDHEHWQLPQGGRDGEKLEIAGARELREELSNDKFKVIKSFKNLNVYEFAKLGLNSGKSGYKGQKQGLLITEFTGQDDDIKINYWDHAGWKWVDIDKFIESVYPSRREGYQKFYKAFLETVK